ncbi:MULTISPECIES: iron uptake system protein EfeO [Inquilinus]|uniref:Iron uptake system component EfeO n=1 Tax=Inquilinus ginsengisoli TaxID=363840 RepID=A0ABU1K1S7_9PROT|nr:iron uptake system protein EfeO [Inquilinus ginsengisoli]MDR6294518.1 iron uptake system component EfeO [Inquilinus ginsengisoli]
MSLQRTTRIGLGVVAVLAVAVAGLGVYAYLHRAPRPAAGGTAVTITAKTCEPNALTVEAGRVTFQVLNQSDRALEWEILQGVMVVEERENIAPGFTQSLTARLEPGTYQITCGLLSNPRGTLTVTAAKNAPAEPLRPSLIDLIGPIAEYKVYVTTETADLAAATPPLVAAVKAGDLTQARALLGPAWVHYQRIKPIADLFGDLDTALDGRADYFEKKEQDPGFTGFRRLQYGLFTENSTEGLGPVADKLAADVQALQARIADLSIPPDKMAGGAAAVIARLAADSNADTAGAQADVEGAAKIVGLLRPLSQKADKALSDRIDGDLTAAGLALSKDDRAGMQAPVASLADALPKLRTTLGLD